MAGLATLADRELLVRRQETRFPGEEELAFRHALLREGAYAMLTEGDRTLGHRLAGEWLEARGEQDARALAEHFEKGGDGPAAGRHYLRAAQQAGWGASVLEQAALARRGLALPLPDDLRVRLLGSLCETALWQPDLATSVQTEAEELMKISPRGSAPWFQGAVARLTRAAVAGDAEEVFAITGEIEHADVAPDAVHPMALTLALAIHVLDLAGRSPSGEALFAKLEAMMAAHGDRSMSAMSVFLLMAAEREEKNDNLVGTLEHARRGMDLARQCGHRRIEGLTNVVMAMSIWCLGAPEEAERRLKAVPMADTEFGPASAFRPFAMTWMLAERGALAEARTSAEHLAFTLGRARGLPVDEGRGRWALAEVLRRMGALADAETEVEHALALLGRTCPAEVPGVLATKAALKLAQGKPAEALAAAEEGLSRQAAMRLYDRFFRGGSFLRLIHVESLLTAGRHEEARAALASARARLCSVAAKITDPAYQKSFFDNVPENRRIMVLAREWLGEEGG